MRKPFFTQEFPSTCEALREALGCALAALVEHEWIERDRDFFVRLCLEEAMVNAITHGNKCDQTRSVRVEMAEGGDRCHIRVFDQGAGFFPENVPPPGPGRVGGRGLCLIKHYMENVTYNDADNCLEMTLRRKREAPTHEQK